MTEPSGVYSEWYAQAIGRSSKTVRDFLETHYYREGIDIGQVCGGMTRPEAIKLSVRALLEVVQTGSQFVEVAVIDAAGVTTFVSDADIKALIDEIDRDASQAMTQ